MGYSNAPSQNYVFQKQERISDFDLGLNWFKYRPFYGDIGRGLQVDRLGEKYVYNSSYAFSENKVITHLEIDGLETVNYKLPWHEENFNKPSQKSLSKPEFKTSFNSSLGIQGGLQGKLLGFKAGLFVNLGAVDMGSSDRSSTKTELSVSHGIEGGIGILGGKLMYTHGKDGEGNQNSKLEYGINIGPIEINQTDTKVTNVQGTKSSQSDVKIDIGRTGIAGGIIGKIDLDAKYSIPIQNTGNSKQYNSTDNTRVDNTHLLLKTKFLSKEKQ